MSWRRPAWIQSCCGCKRKESCRDCVRSHREYFPAGCMADLDAQALLDALPDPLLAADAGGRIVLINAKAERLLAWPRAELLGQPIAVVLPQAAAGRVPARRKDGAEVVVELSETAAGLLRVYVLLGVSGGLTFSGRVFAPPMLGTVTGR